MASSMIHYVISRKVAEHFDIKDLNLFLFGAVIVPDCGSHEDSSYDFFHCKDVLPEKGIKGFNHVQLSRRSSERMAEDFFLGYFCHVMQDNIWFHDIVNPNIRIYPKDVKAAKYQTVYRDYYRLNYILQKEYDCPFEPIHKAEVPIKEADDGRVDALLNLFKDFLTVPESTKDELELLTWNKISTYIDKCINYCIEEIKRLKAGEELSDPAELYVPI